MIRIRSLRKRYGVGDAARDVLRGIDLDIHRGELVAVEGVSGCGKTTLLNLLGGLDRAYEGSIVVGGQDLATLSDARLAAFRNRTVGFVFQHFHLLDHLTCRENVSLPRFFQAGSGRQEAQRRAQEVLQRVGLGDRAEEFPSRLSGGQKQRVAIARALFNRPELILCDEPTGNLDTATGQQILDLFRRLQGEDDITQIIVTHERRVSQSAQRVIRLADGRVVADGEDAAPIPGEPP